MNSKISGLSIAVITASLLAVGVVAAISMTEEADAGQSVTITSSTTQNNGAGTTQSSSATSGGSGSASASNTATTSQSNTATTGISVSQTR